MEELINDLSEQLDNGSLSDRTFDETMYDYGFDGDPLELLEGLM